MASEVRWIPRFAALGLFTLAACVCPSLQFICPASGAYSVMVGSFFSSSNFVCDVAESHS